MRFELKAGAEIDVLTPAELAREVDRLRDEVRATTAITVVIAAATVTTDGTGNLPAAGIVIYEVPAGMAAKVHRMMFDAAGYTPAAPLTTGWLKWTRNAPGAGNLLGFLPVSSTAVLPAWITEGQHDAAHLRDGEQLVLTGAALPANLTISVEVQVSLVEKVTSWGRAH